MRFGKDDTAPGYLFFPPRHVVRDGSEHAMQWQKGGIDHCQGKTFICRDGSVSKSKKNCQAVTGAVGRLGSDEAEMRPAAGNDCSCRSGTFCTGARGGRYCVEDDGDKSYLRSDLYLSLVPYCLIVESLSCRRHFLGDACAEPLLPCVLFEST